jgi:response regulator of citrate/malate metabolism
MDSSKPRRVLVIEDDMELTTILERVLRVIDSKVQIEWATSAEEATSKLVNRARHTKGPPYDLIVADIFLEGNETGLDLWKLCAQAFPDVPIVITSALPIDKYFTAIGQDMITPPFLAKPFTASECRQVFKGMFEYADRRTL